MRLALTLLAAILAALYLAALAALYFAQRSVLYVPIDPEQSPASVGLGAEVRHIATSDGETLLAWWTAPKPGRPTILYFHGNANGLAARGERFAKLTATGDGLFAVEYRGYKGSTGRSTEAGLLLDGEAAYDEALRLGAAPKMIVAMGESLGTGVAVALAAKREVGALVLDSPYTSTVDVAAERYWMFPVRALMLDTFHSDQRIGAVHAPLLVVHGSADATVPIRFGERLFGLANGPKAFIRVEAYGHLALGQRVPQVLEWIDGALAPF